MERKRRSLLIIILKYTTAIIVTALILAGSLVLLVYVGAFGPLPDKDALSSIKNEEASLVYSSDRIIIGKYFAQNRTNINLEEIPEHLKNALIATEDRRFLSHNGIDPQSYFRVILKSILLRDNRSGGGSTLTQQLVKNLYGRSNFGFLSLPVNKIKEILIAARIEAMYTKEELILLYLNSVPFGEDVYGIESAAHRYFNKTTRQLKIEESAVLIGMLKANTYFNPRLYPENSLERRNLVISLMEKELFLLPNEADSLKRLPLGLHYENESLNTSTGYFVHQVKNRTLELLSTIKLTTGREYTLEKDGLRIYTTLNMNIQEMAARAINGHLSAMQILLDRELEQQGLKKQWYQKQKQLSRDVKKDMVVRETEVFTWNGTQTKTISRLDSLWYYYKMLHAAVLIANPKNGSVITWIGGNHFRFLPFDMVLSHRQSASVFKPILYATALENGFTPCTYLENTEKEYPEYEGWHPQNYDGSSTPDSTVALWYALAHSMNLPAVDLYFKLGRENLLNTCNKLRFPQTSDDAPSIAIGTLDVSLYEMVKAYAAFAHQGRSNELVLIDKITDAQGNTLYRRASAQSVEVFRPETCEMITAMLQTAIREGTGKNIRSVFGVQADLAGKTGTAQNYSDAWFMAFTPDLVLGTWVGASTPDVHFNSWNGSGSSLALPVIGAILRDMEQNPGLSNRYLTPFLLPEEVYSYMQCEPYREIGMDGFFDRIFKREERQKTNIWGFFKTLLN